MNTPQDAWSHAWNRLARAARSPEEPPQGAPLGFATRVVARWRDAASVEMVSPWELLSLKSLAFALLVMFVSLGVSYPSLAEQLAGDSMEPVALITLLSGE